MPTVHQLNKPSELMTPRSINPKTIPKAISNISIIKISDKRFANDHSLACIHILKNLMEAELMMVMALIP